MRRISFAVAALLLAATALAIDTRSHPITIALLAPAEKWPDPRDGRDFLSFRRSLAGELRSLGYDAFLRDETIKDFGPDSRPLADYYVEVVDAGGTLPRNAVAVGAGPVDVGVGVTHVGAAVNLYDGRTTQLMETVDPRDRSALVTPVSLGLSGRSFFAAIALPFVEWAQGRNAMRLLARDAAHEIDKALRH